ncbi:MAG: chromosomal replication initiator protein DnaA [Bdellovibrionales bacterium]|nr:chromosomal replication initiator protein DnaA [Bdellovibrionales bacterium]
MRTLLQQDVSQWPEVWRAVYRHLETEGNLTPQQLQLWIAPLRLIGIQEIPSADGVSHVMGVQMAAQTDFASHWIATHFQPQLEQAFTQILGQPASLSVVVAPTDGAAEAMEPHSEPLLPKSAETGSVSAPDSTSASLPPLPDSGVLWGAMSRSPQSQSTQFDPRYTFDSFVVGASNQFAHASAFAVSENPARQYNPLFLYSQPGLGKTHLLHAIANGVLARNPNARVLYISAERFVNEMIESIQHHKTTEFRKKYRDSYDVILFDDIQFIAGKERTEEEFFHTFNALHSSKRQIVLTSDRPPKEIEGLEERLRTRFEWGLIADITPPEIETRIAILKAKAERDDIYLPDEVATFLATYIKSNVRELEGVLIKLQAHASLTGAELSLELAKQQLKLVVPEQGSNYTIESIQSAVAKHFRLKAADFKSNSKQRSVARPRQIAMYLIRKYTSLGFKEIGHYFGGRDHTTIMHACREIEKKIDSEQEVKDAVEAIQNLL